MKSPSEMTTLIRIPQVYPCQEMEKDFLSAEDGESEDYDEDDLEYEEEEQETEDEEKE
jgi:hypothetical protein